MKEQAASKTKKILFPFTVPNWKDSLSNDVVEATETDRLKRGLNKLMEDRSISDYEAEWPQIQLWLRTALH